MNGTKLVIIKFCMTAMICAQPVLLHAGEQDAIFQPVRQPNLPTGNAGQKLPNLASLYAQSGLTNNVPVQEISKLPPMELAGISAARVQAVHDAYAREAGKAPYVSFAVGLTTAAAAALIAYNGYMAYRHLVSHNFVERVENCEKMGIMLNNKIDALARNQKLPQQQNTWADALKGTAWGLGTFFFSQGIMAAGYNLVVSPVLETAMQAKASLPATGTLSWYIHNRTSYNNTLGVLFGYMKRNFTEEVVRQEPSYLKSLGFNRKLRATLQLFIYDLEKILGYLQYFETTLSSKKHDQEAVRDCCKGYAEVIEQAVITVVDLAKAGGDIKQPLSEQLLAIANTVMDAQKFVQDHYQ